MRRLDVISTVVFMILLGVLGWLIMAGKIAVVSSWSMEPVLHVGDMIVIGSKKFRAGDLVVYHRGGLIVHRVVNFKPLVIQGDANSFPDATVPLRAIKGRVELVIPYLGVFKLFVERLVGLFQHI